MNPTETFLDDTLRAAGRELTDRIDKTHQIITKADSSIVTEADLASETLILEAIRKSYPEDIIMSEEAGLSDTERQVGRHIWIIDPLDGTTNYANRYPFYCVSIGRGVFDESGNITIKSGGIYAPSLGEMYYASLGQGAFCNGERISVSSTASLESAFLCTGFYYDKGDALAQAVERFSSIAQKCQAIRRDGSAALDLAYTAKGVFDGFWEVGLQPWDLAAGVLLVTEAGGSLRNYPLAKTTKNLAKPYNIEEVGLVCGGEAVSHQIWELL